MVPDIVMPEIRVTEPNTELVVEPKLHVGVPVEPAQVMLRPSRGISAVTVWLAENAELIVTSSWGSGTRLVQALADQLAPVVPDQVCAALVVKVMPELPPQSPLLPVMADAFQAVFMVMSMKSTFWDPVMVAPELVNATAVPAALAWTSIRLVTLFPEKVSVPVTVFAPLIVRASVFAAVPVRVKVAATALLEDQVAVPLPVMLMVP